jgi:hypothetical protein
LVNWWEAKRKEHSAKRRAPRREVAVASTPAAAPRESATPIRVGISACLLGQEVRFDGGHKRDRYITDTLGKFFEWVPVCPEVEMGLGRPRETLRR